MTQRYRGCPLSRIGVLVLVLASSVQANEIRNSVVKIIVSKSPPNMFRPWEVTAPSDASGSGVVIEGGRILTNAHVVNYAQQIYVQPYEKSDKLDATVEFISEDCDLATLKLDDPEEIKNIPPLSLAETIPSLNAKVNVFGYPTGGNTLSITEGVVSRIEYTKYTRQTGALLIQVDAAINPGNSGGPGIVKGKITGIVFSRFRHAENIGYLIPVEVVRHFLDDWASDGKYDGFPSLGVRASTLENPTLRKYLKLDKSVKGVVIHRVMREDLRDLLKPWDVVLACDGVDVDNTGMIPIGDGIRVQLGYLISRKAPGSSIPLTILRGGKKIEFDVPTTTKTNLLLRDMEHERPTYFVYGGLVFSPVTAELLSAAGTAPLGLLAVNGSLLTQLLGKQREHDDDEIVVTCSPILPHKINKGYEVGPLSVVTHVNATPIRNLRHMIELIKENKEEFIVFRFGDKGEDKLVFDPKKVEQLNPQILRNYNIPSACSEDLRDICP